MSFVKATRILFVPGKFLRIILVNLKDPQKKMNSKLILFWKFYIIILMILHQTFFIEYSHSYPIVTLKDLANFGQYLTYLISIGFLCYLTVSRTEGLRQLYIKFYELSENPFYSEINYNSISVLCKFLTLFVFLLEIQQLYIMIPKLPNIWLYKLLIFFVNVWLNNAFNYTFFLIITYILILSLYFSEINQILKKKKLLRKSLHILMDIYTKNYQLAEDLNNVYDIFLLPILLSEFFWIISIMYSKIYILVENGYISIIEILDFIKNISFSIIYIAIFLWVCSKTKNMVSIYYGCYRYLNTVDSA